MKNKIALSCIVLLVIVAACTPVALPAFDTSNLAVEARASAEVAIVATQVEIQAQHEATQIALASQVSHLERVQAADAVNGEMLFNTFQSEAGDSGWSCMTCHLTNSEAQLVGPGLLNVSVRGESRVDGQDAAEYIFTSITNPDAYIVEPFSDELMPENWADIYTEDEIYDIVAYLFTLSDGSATSDTSASESVDVGIPSEIENSDAANGEVLFMTFQADAGDSGWACMTCHLTNTEAQLVGPGLLNISGRAASRVDGQNAYDYVLSSITNPAAYVVEPFSDELMPENWADIYTDNEINDIIAYLWTLND